MTVNRRRYRLRTWLRIHTPYVVSDRIEKGDGDCGAHEWYLAEGTTWHCYRCTAVGESLRVPWSELAAVLHDASLDLDTVRTDDGLTVQGLRYVPGPSRRSRARTVPFVLRVPRASDVEADDPDAIRVVVVAEVLRDGASVVITSAARGSLRFTTPEAEAEVSP